MKIFILKPSKDWAHCGGGRVIIANSLERAKEMIDPDNFEKFFTSEEEAYKSGGGCDVWVLVREIEAGEMKEEIILDDYNWA